MANTTHASGSKFSNYGTQRNVYFQHRVQVIWIRFRSDLTELLIQLSALFCQMLVRNSGFIKVQGHTSEHKCGFKNYIRQVGKEDQF